MIDDWPDDPAERLDRFLAAPLLPPFTPIWNAPIPSGPRDSALPRLSLAAAFRPPPRRPAPSFWLAETLPKSAPPRLSPLRPSRFRKR